MIKFSVTKSHQFPLAVSGEQEWRIPFKDKRRKNKTDTHGSGYSQKY